MTPKFSEDKLTAYVLNEISQADRKLVEHELKNNPILQTEVAAIRAISGMLGTELKNEPQLTLTAEQKKKFHRSHDAETHDKEKQKLKIIPNYRVGLLSAAAILLMVAVPNYLRVQTRMKEASFKGGSERNDLNAVNQSPAVEQENGDGGLPEGPNTRGNQEGQAEESSSDSAQLGVKPPASTLSNAASGEPHRSDSLRTTVQRNTESYDQLVDNPFYSAQKEPLSTFSIDTDTASYANVRRFLNGGKLPPKDAIRIEELLNYFNYHYAGPSNGEPFSVDIEAHAAPWEKSHRLVKIGIQGKKIEWGERPPSNLVFLVDVSGSMAAPEKLPLLKQSFKMLIDHFDRRDRVAIVVYAGASGVVLDSTAADQKGIIVNALDRMMAGGSTNGASGIDLAYQIAEKHFVKGGINRVILATDGDFNVGSTNQGDLIRLIEQKAKSGVFLTVLGFGMGNIKDSTLEKLADKGNGNYAYVDSLLEAKRVLVEQAGGTMMTIAKDVKIQVEFNPEEVKAYRLIGYENRILKNQDFNDDTVDAGEVGSDQSVTALYEIVPKGVSYPIKGTDELKYQNVATKKNRSGEMLSVKMKYKEPDGTRSKSIELTKEIGNDAEGSAGSSQDFKFAAAVAEFGMIMRRSEYRGTASFDDILTYLENSGRVLRDDSKSEFLALVKKAQSLGADK